VVGGRRRMVSYFPIVCIAQAKFSRLCHGNLRFFQDSRMRSR
jgi:hypothetical protein